LSREPHHTFPLPRKFFFSRWSFSPTCHVCFCLVLASGRPGLTTPHIHSWTASGHFWAGNLCPSAVPSGPGLFLFPCLLRNGSPFSTIPFRSFKFFSLSFFIPENFLPPGYLLGRSCVGRWPPSCTWNFVRRRVSTCDPPAETFTRPPPPPHTFFYPHLVCKLLFPFFFLTWDPVFPALKSGDRTKPAIFSDAFAVFFEHSVFFSQPLRAPRALFCTFSRWTQVSFHTFFPWTLFLYDLRRVRLPRLFRFGPNCPPTAVHHPKYFNGPFFTLLQTVFSPPLSLDRALFTPFLRFTELVPLIIGLFFQGISSRQSLPV